MTRPFRVAVVGAGPAGIYAGNILRTRAGEAGIEVQIDLFESLPSPYGLIRYGVAPDHPRIKGIVTSLHDMLADGAVRLLGNVEIGADITVDELQELYHAVVFATGAQVDRHFDLPGLEKHGSFGAADFVSWYDGHPDVPREWPLNARQIAVLGNGNVALDVARVLAKHPVDLLTTDIPENVYAGLAASPVTDVHVFGRRGPHDIKFTPIELRELGEVPGVDIVLYDEDFENGSTAVGGADKGAGGRAGAGEAAANGARRAVGNQAKVMARILQSWRERESTDAPRRLHLHFWHRPVEILGDGDGDGEGAGRVTAIRFERTEPDGAGGIRGTGEFVDYGVQAVYRAIGYRGTPVRDVPFDEAAGVIPNDGGRVLDENGAAVPRLYATGWIKRGPVGLIGHTKGDAAETVEKLLEDHASLSAAERPDEDAVIAFLRSRGVRFTTWDGWLALDEHERALGEEFPGMQRERIKVVSRDEQVAISNREVVAR
ncbi:FAD-dependent oxidoreductase [Humibacter albus]|uniref:FAD-dependent oxidoreductase n=1 Tax=Humibacter albus TaxID=427754 RepID=UPI0003B3FE6A|nr:FAD-dependent oxidoreductase [Humibacter albus]